MTTIAPMVADPPQQLSPLAVSNGSAVHSHIIIIGLTAAFGVNYVLAASAGASTEPFWAGIAAWR